MNPLVSVVVTTYNRKEMLEKVIKSILSQTYNNFELIVVDNFSKYNFFEYLGSFNDSRITGFQNSNDGIIAVNRNFGISKSSGKFIAFCDDDDLWLPEKLAKQVLVLEANTKIKLCCTDRVNIDSEGKIISQDSLNWIPAKFTLKNLLLTNFVTLSSVLVGRQTLNEVGVFSENKNFFAVEDYHLWIRIAIAGGIYFIDEKLLQYRVHDANYSRKRSIGVLNTRRVYKDIFANYKFSLNDKIRTFAVSYIKFLTYKLRGL